MVHLKTMVDNGAHMEGKDKGVQARALYVVRRKISIIQNTTYHSWIED